MREEKCLMLLEVMNGQTDKRMDNIATRFAFTAEKADVRIPIQVPGIVYDIDYKL